MHFPKKNFRVSRAALFFLCSSTLVVQSVASFAEEESDDSGFNVKAGFDRTVGKYGQAKDTTISTRSLTITYSDDDYSFDLATPFVEQKGPGRLIFIPGRRPRVIAGPERQVAGKGDVTLGGTKYLLNEEDHGLDLDVGAIVKFGTGSYQKGLGSGENDYSLQSSASRSFGDFNLSLTAGYTFIGKPPTGNYQNAYYGSFDASYKLTDSIRFGSTYSDGGTVVKGLSPSRDITYYLDFRPLKSLKIEIYGLSGRSSQSPNRGGGVTVALDI